MVYLSVIAYVHNFPVNSDGDPLLPRGKGEAMLLFPLMTCLEEHPGKNNPTCLDFRGSWVHWR